MSANKQVGTLLYLVASKVGKNAKKAVSSAEGQVLRFGSSSLDEADLVVRSEKRVSTLFRTS